MHFFCSPFLEGEDKSHGSVSSVYSWNFPRWSWGMLRICRCHIAFEIKGSLRQGNAIEAIGKELRLILKSETRHARIYVYYAGGRSKNNFLWRCHKLAIRLICAHTYTHYTIYWVELLPFREPILLLFFRALIDFLRPLENWLLLYIFGLIF